MRVSPNVFTGCNVHMHLNTFSVLCRVKANEQKRKEQKSTTTKLAEFHGQFVLLTGLGQIFNKKYLETQKKCAR